MKQPFPQVGFVRLPQVLSVIPLSRSTWLRGVKSGKYPQPVSLTERTRAWRVEDILELIDSLSETAAS
ncbi:helix-turn-helix transcriptional regulator [Pseudodesulfovibrio profundus]|uniref:helix-turn-helix transcriptional regulator n=1 Tax=Pseudodesulfovibrio profundus TaxID=57320 RepID=UPI000BE3A50C|nr:AlpA family phage regulatory protein [Pseudodesulfovibrio profundus]